MVSLLDGSTVGREAIKRKGGGSWVEEIQKRFSSGKGLRGLISKKAGRADFHPSYSRRKEGGQLSGGVSHPKLLHYVAPDHITRKLKKVDPSASKGLKK